MKRIWIYISSLTLIAQVMAGNGMIEGKVTDKESGEPLPGANIVVVGTSRGAASDIEGSYLIVNVPPGEYTVEANYIGYQKVKAQHIVVEADKTTRLDFSLMSETMEGETISVTNRASPRKYSATKKDISMDRNGESGESLKNKEISSSTYSYGTSSSKSSDRKTERRESTAGETSEDLPSHYSKINGELPVRAPVREIPRSSGLRAGFADDNKQYNYFLKFLDDHGSEALHQDIDVSGRIRLWIKDTRGKPLANAQVEISAEDEIIQTGLSYPDGGFNFYPGITFSQASTFQVKVAYKKHSQKFEIRRDGKRTLDVKLKMDKKTPKQAPIDIVFILDTTGSMSEEIARLRATIDLMHLNLTSMGEAVKVRFGMVLYRDRDDDYLTRVISLTGDVENFRAHLDSIDAEGGGDAPEDLQAALDAALHQMDWNSDGIRLGFIITDAAPHLDYGQKYTYLDAVKEAKQKGIRLHSIGTGGLDINGEYVLRQISQFTCGRYIFLTYGEEGESAGGMEGSVSHHTGSNYQTDKLEAIVIQFAKEDLQHVLDREVKSEEDYFLARQVETEENTQTLGKLFDQALSQLLDYSTIQLTGGTVLGLLPIASDVDSDVVNAEYLTEQVMLACKKMSGFKLADRGNLDKVMEEWKLQLSGATSDSATIEIGRLLNAQTLLLGNLFSKEGEYELFLKLVRVETGELLAVTRLRIDRRLCPSG